MPDTPSTRGGVGGRELHSEGLMTPATTPGTASRWGHIETLPEAPEVCARARELVPDREFTLDRYRWVPPPAWRGQLPDNYDFALRCVTTGAGRRFYPDCGVAAYLATAFAGGLVVLTNLRPLSPEEQDAYRLQWLWFQRAQTTGEHLRDDLEHVASLRLRRSARGLENTNSILPESIGQDEAGEGEPWSLDRLLDIGRREARAAGKSNVSAVDCVKYGLLSAARRNPLWVQPKEVPGLVRGALYDTGDLPTLPKDTKAANDTIQEVVWRTLEAMRSHRRDSTGDFDRWFWGPNNTLAKQVGQRKKAPGGSLDPRLVRRVLLGQGWRAYAPVANCLHAMMFHFRHLLPTRLTEDENRLFERTYLRQPFLGDLPLLMLHERFPAIDLILPEVCEEEDNSEAVAVMHRRLAYYGEMAPARRDADRLVQSRRAGTKPGAPVPVTVPLPQGATAGGGTMSGKLKGGAAKGDLAEPAALEGEEADASAEKEGQCPHGEEGRESQEEEGAFTSQVALDPLSVIAEGLASRHHFACGCPCPTWKLNMDHLDADTRTFTVTLYCASLAHEDGSVPVFERTITASLAELQDVARAENLLL
jgi:hypothetical protein